MARAAKTSETVAESTATEETMMEEITAAEATTTEEADAKPTATANPGKEERVRFKIPLGESDKERGDVFVGVNGKTYLIKRGVVNELPRSVVEVLENAEAQREFAIEYEETNKYRG